MSKFLIGLVVVVVAGGLFAVTLGSWVLGTYNGFVTNSAAVDTQWAQVETQYQRRYDLIPGLVGATRGFLKQEQKVFGDIAEARTHYANSAPGSSERVAATNQVEGALSRLLVVMENYPVLQSNETVRDLMTELAGTENRISVARQRYNEQVQGYNVSLKTFPASIVANFAGFKEKTFFKSDDAAKTAPTVNLE